MSVKEALDKLDDYTGVSKQANSVVDALQNSGLVKGVVNMDPALRAILLGSGAGGLFSALRASSSKDPREREKKVQRFVEGLLGGAALGGGGYAAYRAFPKVKEILQRPLSSGTSEARRLRVGEPGGVSSEAYDKYVQELDNAHSKAIPRLVDRFTDPEFQNEVGKWVDPASAMSTAVGGRIGHIRGQNLDADNIMQEFRKAELPTSVQSITKNAPHRPSVLNTLGELENPTPSPTKSVSSAYQKLKGRVLGKDPKLNNLRSVLTEDASSPHFRILNRTGIDGKEVGKGAPGKTIANQINQDFYHFKNKHLKALAESKEDWKLLKGLGRIGGRAMRGRNLLGGMLYGYLGSSIPMLWPDEPPKPTAPPPSQSLEKLKALMPAGMGKSGTLMANSQIGPARSSNFPQQMDANPMLSNLLADKPSHGGMGNLKTVGSTDYKPNLITGTSGHAMPQQRIPDLANSIGSSVAGILPVATNRRSWNIPTAAFQSMKNIGSGLGMDLGPLDSLNQELAGPQVSSRQQSYQTASQSPSLQ